MPTLPWRVQQSTSTTGTGTVALNTVAAGRRSFQDAFGTGAARVPYVISGASFFEIGYGDFDGGSPGTLSRVTVLASSNASALVSLPAGTADVFPFIDPAMRPVKTGTAGIALAATDLGSFTAWTGSTAQNATLPAIATVPAGQGFLIRNAGSAILTVLPNATETIDGAGSLALAPGGSAEILRVGAAWVTAGAVVQALSSLLAAPPPIGGTTPAAGSFTTLAASGNASVGGTFGVTGNTTLSGSLGVTGKASAAAGTAGNDLVNWSQFARATGTTGQLSRPDGSILKWGTGTYSGGTGSVTFASAFPAACDWAAAFIATNGSAHTSYPPGVDPTTRTVSGFTVYGGTGQSGSFSWLAIGR